MIEFPRGLEPLDDLSAADWVREALKDCPTGKSFLIRDLIPPVFEAYARILHRPHRVHDGLEPTGTWKERAAELGTTPGSGDELEGSRRIRGRSLVGRGMDHSPSGR